jgi:hypothetical protein
LPSPLLERTFAATPGETVNVVLSFFRDPMSATSSSSRNFTEVDLGRKYSKVQENTSEIQEYMSKNSRKYVRNSRISTLRPNIQKSDFRIF